MTTKDALSYITAPKGITSIIEGLMNKDFSVLPKEGVKPSSLQEAEKMIAKYQNDLDNCKSDWAYWSILGDLEYWKAVRNILEAGDLVGHDNLPNVPTPREGLVVMDAIYEVTKFGENILKAAKKTVAN